MNEFVLNFPDSVDPCILVISATRLLDTGAELAKLSAENCPGGRPMRFGMIRYADFAESVGGKLKPVRD